MRTSGARAARSRYRTGAAVDRQLLLIRPEQFVRLESPGRSRYSNSFDGIIDDVMLQGDSQLMTVGLPSGRIMLFRGGREPAWCGNLPHQGAQIRRWASIRHCVLVRPRCLSPDGGRDASRTRLSMPAMRQARAGPAKGRAFLALPPALGIVAIVVVLPSPGSSCCRSSTRRDRPSPTTPHRQRQRLSVSLQTTFSSPRAVTARPALLAYPVAYVLASLRGSGRQRSC